MLSSSSINTAGGTDTALTTMSTQPSPPTSCVLFFWMSIKTKVFFFPSWIREIPTLWTGKCSHARGVGLKVRKRSSCPSTDERNRDCFHFPVLGVTTPVGESRLSVTWLPARAKRMVNMIQYKQGRGKGGWHFQRGAANSQCAEVGGGVRQPMWHAAELCRVPEASLPCGHAGRDESWTLWELVQAAVSSQWLFAASLDYVLHRYIHFPWASPVPPSQPASDPRAGNKEHFKAKHRPAEPGDLSPILVTSSL